MKNDMLHMSFGFAQISIIRLSIVIQRQHWAQQSCKKQNVLKILDYHGPMGHAGSPVLSSAPISAASPDSEGEKIIREIVLKTTPVRFSPPPAAGRCFGILTGCRRCHATGHWPELTPRHQEGHWHWHLTEHFIDSPLFLWKTCLLESIIKFVFILEMYNKLI